MIEIYRQAADMITRARHAVTLTGARTWSSGKSPALPFLNW
jgi:hypothetical protein